MNNQEVIEAVRKYMADTETSQNKTAAQIGISEGHMSALMTGKFDKISEAMWQKVHVWVSRYIGKKWKLVSTSTYETVHTVCRRAAEQGKMMVVKGASGCGKSEASRQYKLRNANTYYMECVSSDSVVGFLKAICGEMGIRKEMNRGDMVREIARKLTEAPNSLLIIDEAGVLKGKSKSIVALKDIYNLTGCRAGIVLVGVDYMYSALETRARNQHEGYPELLSRVAYAGKVVYATATECLAIIRENGLSHLKENEQRYLMQWSGGDLRKLNNIVEQIHFELKGDVTLDLLKATFPITK